jgi:CheY-like chemotaxis protein
MSHIGILIVDDDIIKISMIIKTIQEVVNDTLAISQASSVQEAIENLQSKQFHLLITDLQMPLKHDSPTDDDGGKALIRNMYRKKSKANIPMYIVGLTQFEHLQADFKGVWKVWHYDSSKEDWKVNLRDLIHHINMVKSRINSERKETIFVEGPTDKKLILATIEHFFKEYSEKVFIETINYGGGAHWVERQIIIWAKTLARHSSEERYLKAVGIFDNDLAGMESIEKLNELIENNSAESQTFSILRNCYKYSTILKSIKKKGIVFQTTLEDLIDIQQWHKAKNSGWLTKRDQKFIEINSDILDLPNVELNDANLLANGFTNDEVLIITHKVEDDFKKDFINLICETPDSLIAIKYQFEEILEKLKIPYSR